MGLDQYFFIKKNGDIVKEFYYRGFNSLHLYMCKHNKKILDSIEYPFRLKDVCKLKEKIKKLLLIVLGKEILYNKCLVECNPIENSIVVIHDNNKTNVVITKEFLEECRKKFPTSRFYYWGECEYDIMYVDNLYCLYHDLLTIETTLKKDRTLELTYDSWW